MASLIRGPRAARALIYLILGGLVAGPIGCGSTASGPDRGAASLNGSIRIDGSSTVYPVSQAAAEVFGEEHPRVRVSVSRSGTSAGFAKFLQGEIDICDASRPIQEGELAQAKASGEEILEFTVALDGLAVVVHPESDWCDSMTVEQLKAIWRPESTGEIVNWNQIDDSWADLPLSLYGPGTASRTFEYFTEEICGEKKASRSDYQRSEDDNMLVRGVAGEKGSLGYFGYAYYAENKESLKLLAIDSGNGPVLPTDETVRNGTYAPLSRPLFIYVKKSALQRPEVATFIKFYLAHADELAVDAQYVPVSEEINERNEESFRMALP